MNLTVMTTYNDYDGLKFFVTSVQENNEFNGINILFSFNHYIYIDGTEDTIRRNTAWEHSQLVRLLKLLGANVSSVIVIEEKSDGTN